MGPIIRVFYEIETRAAQDQNLDLQTDELTKLGCQKIYHETVSLGFDFLL